MHHSRSPTGPHLILSIDAAPHAVDSSAFSSEWSHTTDLNLCFPPDAVSGPDEEARLWRDGRVRTFKATLLLWHYLLEWPRHADTPQAHPLLASHVGGWRGLLRECRRHCDKGTRAHTHTHKEKTLNTQQTAAVCLSVSVRRPPQPVQQHAGGTVELVALPVAARVDAPAEVQQQHRAVHPRHRQ